jgi:sulfur relay (sulfurtransferase) complex TusBCD TusD component (DsrE family)
MLEQPLSIIVGYNVAIWITKIAADSRGIDDQTACDMSNQLSLVSIN